MKVLFVGNGMLRSDKYPTTDTGGSVQTWALSKELAKRGHEIYIIRRSRIKEMVADRVNLLGIDFYGVDCIGIPFWSYPSYLGALITKFHFSRKSLGIIVKIKPDVVFLIDRFTGIFPSYLEIPKIYIMHAPETLDFYKYYSIHSNKLNSVMFYIKKIVESRILRSVDIIVVLSSFMEKCLRVEGLNKVASIPNGIDTESFSNKGDQNLILYAGRFDSNKNVCSLVNAFAEVRKLHPDYKLCLVGEGPEEGKIRAVAKERGLQFSLTIIPWMHRDKLAEVMGGCSVFVLPSTMEAFGVVIIEAMACGKPVIARQIPGPADIITHGWDGFLFEGDDELRKYLELLVSDEGLRKKMGCNARETIKKRFSYAQIAEKYEELLHRLDRQKFEKLLFSSVDPSKREK